MEILLKERLDHYWRKIKLRKNAVGDLKYPLIIKVFKAALSLAHGNAEVERGFSESGKYVIQKIESCFEKHQLMPSSQQKMV